MRMHRGMYMRNGFGWVMWQAISGLCAVAWRFGTGAHMDGERRSDATWLAPATAPAAGRQLSWWTAMPRLRRAGIRWGITAVVVAVLCGLVVAPTVTRVALVVAAVAAAAYGGYRAYYAWRMRHHHKKYVVPLGSTLGALLGLPCGSPSDIERWLHLPLDWWDMTRRPEMTVQISGTTHYDDKTLRAAEQTISRKLGRHADDMQSQWHMVGEAPYLSVRMREAPPRYVDASEVQHMTTAHADTDQKLPLGLGVGRREIQLDFSVESPHFAFSIPSGKGKSTAVRHMAASALYKGAQLVMLDQKKESHPWLRDIPGVDYADDGEQIFNRLLALDAELTRRQNVAKQAAYGETVDVGPRIYVVFEEQNIGMEAVKAHFDDIKERGEKNPAVRALFNLSCAGRSAKMHLISVAQYFDVPGTCGGKPAVRQNYGIMAIRGKADAWKMLAPQCSPFPRVPDKLLGRVHVVIDGEPVPVQFPNFSEADAIELASAGGHVTVPAYWQIAGSHQPDEAVTGDSVTAVEGPRLYSLREAVDAGLVGDISYDNLRKLKSRDQNFPSGATVGGRQKWEAEAITEWFEARTLVESVTNSESHDDE